MTVGLSFSESATSSSDHQRQNGQPTRQQSPQKLTDPMLLDDTQHTIFIHDIDREIEDSSSQEDTVKFLPGFTGTSIPSFLFIGTKPAGNELVLYQEPTSLTIPKEKDNVRKAIAETRARTRARQAELGSLSTTGNASTESTGAIQPNNEPARQRCGDAMDIDAVF